MGAYAIDERAHPCPRCLAVLDAPIEGGELGCACGWRRRIAARDDAPLVTGPRIDEAERLRMLGEEPDPPYLGEATAIAVAGKPTFSSSEAVTIWQRTYAAAVAQPDDDVAATTLVHFTIACANSIAWERGPRVTRAVIEAALDHTRDPIARQDLRSVLSRGAAREGDLRSAEAWLAPCDPRSPRIRADSTYRISRAILACQADHPEDALAFLGHRPGDVPIGSRMSTTAVLTRAHAHELAGRVDEAVRQLREEMIRRDPGGAAAVANSRPIWQPMEVCPRSLPIASIEHVRGPLANVPVTAMFSRGFASVGGVLVAVGLAIAALGLAIGSWPVVGAALLAIPGAVFLVIGLRRRHLEARMHAVRAHGTPARARIVSLEHLGMSINGYAHVLIQAAVEEDGAPPRPVAFEAMRYYRSRRAGPWIVPYAWLPVRVDPADPSFVVPDLGR